MTQETTLDDIDAEWILQHIASQNTMDRSAVTNIRVQLSATIPTSSGPATVWRDVEITPEEVLGVLRARRAAEHTS